MKKYLKIGVIPVLVLCMTVICTLVSFADKQWTMQTPGVYRMLDGSTLSGVYARGIDTSHWQGDIDWAKVAKDDVTFVMLGTRYKGKVDPKFDYNARNAVKNNIKLGVYIYSYATTVQMAEAEADFVINLIKDYPVSYPVAFDVEDSNTQGKLSKAELTAIIKAFTDKIKAAGYYPMIYANDYWIANKLDMDSIKDLDVWVARYNTKHVYKNPAMWQATETGRVDGFKGNVDIDFQYKDFSSLIPANTWRTINGNTYYYKDYVMQKDTWINDGKNSYYVDANGLARKGWYTENNKKYYLDETDGKLAVGWRQFDNKWYYFSKSGEMQTGWVNENNLWYYLDKAGVMQSGWINLNGERYLLGQSGAMKVGFVSADNKIYFLQDSGVIAKGWINTNFSWYYADKDGVIQTSWVKDKDRWYYMDGTGKMQTGWQDIGGARYYFNESGIMQTGVVNFNEKLYYFEANGTLRKNSSAEYNSKTYDIGEDGVMTERKTENNTGESQSTTPTPGNGTDSSSGVNVSKGNTSSQSTSVAAATEAASEKNNIPTPLPVIGKSAPKEDSKKKLSSPK